MIAEIDFYRSAQIVINEHGDDAESYARSRFEYYYGISAFEHAAAWQVILDAIVKLKQIEPIGTIH